MSLTIGQIAAVSYPKVLAKKRKPENQWEESAFMRKAEKMGMLKRVSFGQNIEIPLDYRRNPGTAILSNELQALLAAKTEVITSAQYDIAEVSAPVIWTKKDEVQNPSENQKIDLVDSLITNALKSHDDILEQYIFATSTNGFLGLLTHCPTSGQGSDGGVDSALETWWRNPSYTYVDDTDIVAAFTLTYNACEKGTGTAMSPTVIVSDGTTQATFEGTQQGLQRWGDGNEANVGFKVLKFKNADYVFSQYASTSAFFLNQENFQILASKEYFRDLGETEPLSGVQNGFVKKLYSAVQTVTNNKSRIGVAHL